MPAEQGARVLFVCTANRCRSPMAEAFARDLADRRSLPVHFHSAGLMEAGQPATGNTLKALTRRGLDAGRHRSTQLAGALQQEPDLIVAMAPDHLQAVAAEAPHLRERAFTLKRLVALAEAEGPRRQGESLGAYLDKLKAGDGGGLTGFSSDDAVADPIGRPRRFYNKTAEEIAGLVQRMFEQLWPGATPD